MSPQEWELVGALIGDGNIYIKNNHYRIHYTGHPIDDLEYYRYLTELVRNNWNKEPSLTVRQRALRMTIFSKEICQKLTDLGIHVGRGKHKHIEIPEKAFADGDSLIPVVRGIADTDGSVFFSDKKGSPDYPSIEMTTCSRVLSDQLVGILNEMGFRVTHRSFKPAKYDTSYRVSLYGRKNLIRWLETIGFSNPTKLRKALGHSANMV